MTTVKEAIAAGGRGQRFTAIIDGALAGAYALPDHVWRSVSALNAIAAEVAGIDADGRYPGNWHQGAEIAQGRVTAARAAETGALPELYWQPLLDAETEANALLVRKHILATAVDHAERNLETVIGDEAIVPCLADALDEVLTAVRTMRVGDIPSTAEDALQGSRAGQEAYRHVQTLLARHRAIRAAQACLRERIPTLDLRGFFGDTATQPERRVTTTSSQILRAGPVPDLERLVWLASPEGRGWVPTAKQQDAAFDEWQRGMASAPFPATVFTIHRTERSTR